MKNVFSVVVAALVVLGAIPALAADGNVPGATLSALGLSGMQEVSDAEGMQVRGMSSSVQASSLSLFNAVLYDPYSGAYYTFSGSSSNRATDENAGLNASSSVNVSSATANATFSATITTGTSTWSAVMSAINVSGMAVATSP